WFCLLLLYSLLRAFSDGRRESERRAQQRRLVERCECRNRGPDIGGELPRLFDPFAVEDILAKRLRKLRLAFAQRRVISRHTAIKGLAKRLHPLRHGEIADAHLAQIGVHVVAKAVEQGLRELSTI